MARKHKPSFRRNADAVVSDATVSAPSCVPPTPASEANTSVSTSEPAVVVQPLPPLPTPMTAWQLCGDTVIGFAHRRKGLPCQDAVAFRQSQRPILALSDGAGSAAISERGAQALVIGVIVDLRCDIAGWERWHWHYAAQQTGTAERFLLMASFAASAPDSSVIKKAEAQMATLERKARAARAEMVPYRQGRKRGAVNRLTRALMAVVKEAGSSEYTSSRFNRQRWLPGASRAVRICPSSVSAAACATAARTSSPSSKATSPATPARGAHEIRSLGRAPRLGQAETGDRRRAPATVA